MSTNCETGSSNVDTVQSSDDCPAPTRASACVASNIRPSYTCQGRCNCLIEAWQVLQAPLKNSLPTFLSMFDDQSAFCQSRVSRSSSCFVSRRLIDAYCLIAEVVSIRQQCSGCQLRSSLSHVARSPSTNLGTSDGAMRCLDASRKRGSHQCS